MESKETEQSLVLEEVCPTAEIHEKVEPTLAEYNGVVREKLLEILPPMKALRLFFMVLKILSCRRRVLEIKVLNSSSSYQLLSIRGRNVFYKLCQISSPIEL